MKKYLLLASILVAMTCLSLTGCSDDDNSSESKQKALVAILKNSDIDYWHQIDKGFSDECKAKGLVPLVFYAKDEANVRSQVDIVNKLEDLEYDIMGIAFAPIWTETDRSAEQAVASFVSRHNIPVTIVDSPIDPNTSPLKDVYISYVGTDNLATGKELAKHLTGAADEILVVRDENSTPTLERYQGLCAEKGKLKIWNTNYDDIKNIEKHIDSNIKTIVFLNGHMCVEALSSVGIYDVYTYDIYNEYVPLINEKTFLKGILAQNTVEMGHMCVKDLVSKPQLKDHFISPIYCDEESIKNIPDEAKPLFEYLQQNSPFKGKTVLLTLGTESSSFWNQLFTGATEKAQEVNVNVKAVFNKVDTDVETCPNAIKNCADIPNLIGVAGQINKKEFDDACASIPNGVNLTLIEGISYKGGVSEQRYNGIVGINNAHYASELLNNIPEQKLLVLAYSTGNNATLTEELIRQHGQTNVRPIRLSDADAAADSLKNVNLKDYDALILASSSFVRKDCMDILSGMTVYSSDLDKTVASYIESGAIRLNISPDSFMFGRLVLLSAITGASYEVPYIITTKENVGSADRTKYLK